MKRFVKYVGVLFAVLFLSGSAWAFNLADHVTLSPNNAGDLLFFKYYVVADGGWETKISVTNTAINRSVVAKVVIRSQVNSFELLDFLIYLSPGDMWTGRLYFDGTDTRIYSEDSSCLNSVGGWASAAAPLDQALNTTKVGNMAWCPLQDTTQMGYIYVVQAAFSQTAPFNTPGVSKAEIKANYGLGVITWSPTSIAFTDIIPPATVPVPGAFDAWPRVVNNNGITTQKFVVWPALGIAPPSFLGFIWNNSLTGYQVFSNAALGLYSAADKPVFLQDYKSMIALNTGATNRLGAWPVGNLQPDANNSLGEIEAVLAKTNISLPFLDDVDNNTVHIMGFPTKYTTSGGCTLAAYTYGGPFFQANITGTQFQSSASFPIFNITVWDVNEGLIGSPFSPSERWRNEVEIFSVTPLNLLSFPEGWIRYPMNNLTVFTTLTQGGLPIQYTGAPVTTSVVNFGLTSGDAWGIGCGWAPPVIQAQVGPPWDPWQIIANYQGAVEAGS